MAIRAGDVVWMITADDGPLRKGLASAKQAAAQAGDAIAANARKIGLAFTAAGTAITATLVASVLKFAKYGDEVAKAAKRTGLSTEAISEFGHAADQSGATIKDFETAIKRMARTITEAGMGMKEYEESLAMLGLSYQDLAGKSPEEQFMIIADRMAQVEDATTKAAIAQEIFGRSGTNLIPMINEGAEGIAELRQEARDLGIVLSRETAAQAELFTDTMDEVKKQLGGVSMQIAQSLLPSLQKMLESLKPIIKYIADWIDRNPELAARLVVLIGALGLLMQAIGPLLIAFPGLIMAFTSLGPLVSSAGAGFTVLRTGLNLLPAAITAAAGPTAAFAVTVGGVVIAAAFLLYKIIELINAIRDYREAMNGLRESQEYARQATVMHNEIIEEHIATLEAAGVAVNRQAMAEMDITRKVAYIKELAAKNNINLSHKQTEAQKQSTKSLEEYGTKVEHVESQVDKNTRRMYSSFLRLDLNQKHSPSINDLAKAAFSDYLDMLGGFADDIWGVLNGIYESWVATWRGITGFVGQAVNWLSEAIGNVGGMLGGLNFGGLPIPQFAEGGLMSESGVALVGERGPELVQLPAGSRVYDNETSQRMMSGSGVTIENISVNVAGSTADPQAMAREFMGALHHRLSGMGMVYGS